MSAKKKRAEAYSRVQEVDSEDDGVVTDPDAQDGFQDANFEEDVEGQAEAMGFQVSAASLPRRSGPNTVSKTLRCVFEWWLT